MNNDTPVADSAPSLLTRFRATAASNDFPSQSLTLSGACSLVLALLILSWLFPPFTLEIGNFHQSTYVFLFGTGMFRGSVDFARLLLIDLSIVAFVGILYKNYWAYRWSVRLSLSLAFVFAIVYLSIQWMPLE